MLRAMNAILRERDLSHLRPGQSARVVAVLGDDGPSQRLRDLGFWPGVEVAVVTRAPFGDPTVYRLQGYRIALRRDEAARVEIEAAR